MSLHHNLMKYSAIGSVEELPLQFRANLRGNAQTPPGSGGSGGLPPK